VFVLVANALDRTPGELEDASSILGGRTWVTARRITIRWCCRRSLPARWSRSCRR
jgi:ABC-type Fe3+ transport system permease subunit